MLEVANAAVHEARRPTGCPTGEIIALEERGAEAAERGIAGNPSSRDAPADHQQVKRFRAESFERLGTPEGASRRSGSHA